VVLGCIISEPTPPSPGEEPPAPVAGDGVYTPIAPGVIYDNLPTLTIVDDSPDQMIGCIIETGNNPQGRLNALFPGAISGDGVIERATNDIWVYDGALWVNAGPTPGPKLVEVNVIPPWNEILPVIARTRTRITAELLAYALELLTEVDLIVTVGAVVDRILSIQIPSTNISVGVGIPVPMSSVVLRVPVAPSILIQAAVPSAGAGIGSLVVAPSVSISIAADPPFIGSYIVRVPIVDIAVAAPLPEVGGQIGSAAQPPAANISVQAELPTLA
jgi:hypothetical protein